MPLSHKRIPDKIVIAELERLQRRIGAIIEEYENTALPNTRIDANLRQAVHTVRDIQKALHLD